MDDRLVLHRRAPWTWVLTAEGPDQLKERHAAAAHSLLRRHGDALRRAFLVSHCLGTPDQPGRSVIEASWDPLPFGIALVARNRTILAANTAADDLLSTQRFFVPPGETRILRAAGLKDRLRLARAIDRILGGESDREATLVEGLRQGEPLPVTLLPCDGKDGLASPPGATPSRRDSLLAIIGDSGESFCARRDIA
ncbi:hypothetical protein VQ042_18220 [Aurantimonas sp. A2-1-M11]|uniref:hypothetical protein n=1 Tax=Aurantimonas sp. A2-1-M11 TaxID=3113712 RepID=UPI002F91FA7A